MSQRQNKDLLNWQQNTSYVSLHPSFIAKGTSVPFSRKYQRQLSSSCGAETSLQQPTLDFYSNYKYLELPGTNCVCFPTNTCLFYAPIPSLYISPQTSSFPSSHKTQLASCYDTQIPTRQEADCRHRQWLPCHYTDVTLTNRLSHCKGTAWVFVLYLTAPSP